jgi:hypothetical protein
MNGHTLRTSSSPRIRQWRRVRVLALAAAALLCAAARSPVLAQHQTGARSGTVAVQNNRDVPVTVYAEDGAFDVKLGTVGAFQVSTLPLPERELYRESIRFLVHPARGFDLETEAFDVHPGVALGLMIPDRPGGGANVAAEPPMFAALSDAERGTATVTIENDRATEDVVFLDWGSFESRLGTVQARSVQTFRIPKSLLDRQVEILIRPRGGQELESAPLTVHLDSHLGVRVPAV